MSESRKKIVSWIVLAALWFVILGSSAFIIAHAEHDCTGGECVVCTALSECHKTLRTFGTASAGTIQPVMISCLLAVICSAVSRRGRVHTTLISLKVELLD
ncbi:hypothetical protein [Ruminococcus albus]|uniref:Conserved domain protein n=1 Tax=Ruminococcus albus 8 TaxID=246199 RepID=E9SCU5_RUMAL|nr:hypothetical protein [Ruminococcus albus]EGC02856.1 conserved domain protein [Ruminococcus albus 8]MCC3352461.1 hypothetical protein [Ruminococcus albus 8]